MPERGTFLHNPEDYGRSVLGKALEYWPAAEKTEVLIVGGIHGEEPDTTVLLSRALRLLPQRPAHASVVATANPDGITRGTRGNANGVDLNRNFPTKDWKPDPITHRWSPNHDSAVQLSPGSAPASEPEIVALVELIKGLEPKRIVSLHGHLDCIEDPANSTFGRWAAKRSNLPLVESVGYATPGSMGTWAAERDIPIITWELAPHSIEHMYSTQLPTLVDLLKGNYDC